MLLHLKDILKQHAQAKGADQRKNRDQAVLDMLSQSHRGITFFLTILDSLYYTFEQRNSKYSFPLLPGQRNFLFTEPMGICYD